MSNRMRTVTTVLAGTAAAFAFAAGTAQAAQSNSVYIYNDTAAGCATSGNNGVAGGVFASYSCVNGVAGHSLFVTAKAGTVSNVYINTLPTLASCNSAGNNGVSGGVFTTFNCQNGVAGYSLSVSG
ncbi:MAG TPA: hypothetical protein VM677_22505 [Actinokineospora sp.]|jgi:hypothetical protein|nr:hypothetical protein [Actinokineospora sp.]